MKTLETKDFIEKMNKEKCGVHYAYKGNHDQSMEELRGERGGNSDGLLGREVNPKIFYAYGIDGAMQIFNRNINIAFTATTHFLNDDIHRKYFPNTVERDIENGAPDRNLTPMEAIEYARRYLDSYVLYVFDAKPNGYEHPELSEDKFNEIQEKIKSFEAVPVVGDGQVISVEDGKNGSPATIRVEKQTEENSKAVNIRELIRKIDDQMEVFYEQNAADLNPEFGRIKLLRGELSMMVRAEAMSLLNQELGNRTSEGNIDRYLFNEDRIKLVDIEKTPHNCFALVEQGEDGSLNARPIGEKDGFAVVTEGGKPARYLDVITELYEQTHPENPAITEDKNFIGLLAKYNRLVKEAKEKHLIKDVEGGPDVENLAFYGEAFVEFEKELTEFVGSMRKMEPINTSRPLPRIEIESDKPLTKSAEDIVRDIKPDETVYALMGELGVQLGADIRAEREGSIKTSDDVEKG